MKQETAKRFTVVRNGVLDAQKRVEDAGLLDNGGLLNFPTGSGKTYLGKKAAIRHLNRGGRVVYVCPIRSLAREVAGEWTADPEFAGWRVGVFTGEVGEDDGSEIISPRDADAAILTSEKLDSYLRGFERQIQWLAEITLVIVDEAHGLGDASRGAGLDGMLTRLLSINPYISVLALTATIGNVDEVAQWLGVDSISSAERWVPLRWRVATFKPGKGGMANRLDTVGREVAMTTREGGQSLVFVQSRIRAEQLAKGLREMGARADAHHAGLSSAERLRVEESFRDGGLDVVCATGTLGQGLNLRVRKVVIHDLDRFEGGEVVPLSVCEVWQLGGRAGRKGKDATGEVVIMAPPHLVGAAWQYTRGDFERVCSPMRAPALLAGQVLAMVGCNLAETVPQLQRVMRRTLAAAQEPGMDDAVSETVLTMLDAGMLERTACGGIKATRLGYAAVRHMLSPATTNAWAHALKLAGTDLRFLDIVLLAASAPECGARLRLRKDQAAGIPALTSGEPMWLRSVAVDEWEALTGQTDGAGVLSGMAAAGALGKWARSGDAATAGLEIGLDADDVGELRKEVLRMLAALLDVAKAMQHTQNFGDLARAPSLEERVKAVLAMVSCGLDARSATLGLVQGVGPVFARKLVDAGIKDIGQLAGCDAQKLMGIDGIAQKRALEWLRQAQSLNVPGAAYRYEETGLWASLFSQPDGTSDRDRVWQLWAKARAK